MGGIGVSASGNSSGPQPTAVIATAAAAIEPWMNATRLVKVPLLINPSR